MRQRFRAFGLFVVAILAITCTDAPTSPDALKANGAGPGHVMMNPTFSPEAARAYKALAAFGVQVTEIHIQLTGPDGSVKDTTLAFPASQEQITIDIPVPVSGTDQPFSALIELRNDQHVVLFSGTQIVIARARGLPNIPPPVVVIQYTGPGKGTKTVMVGPPDTTIAGTAAVALRATGVDNSGLAVTDLLVQWTVSDANLAIATSTGNAAATLNSLGRRGIATVTATTPLGVSGSSRMTFVPAPARVVVISGGGQTGIAGDALAQPLVVEVQAADNLPVPGVAVAFRAVTAGGSVQKSTVIADGVGRAISTLTLGKSAGTYQYEAAFGALPPASINATALPAPAAKLEIESGNGQTDSIGRTLALPLVVKITDQYGGLVQDAKVLWTRVAGNGSLGVATSLSDVKGLASNSYTLGNVAGYDTVRATVSGINGPDSTALFSIRAISRSPASLLIVSGGGQSGGPNTTLPTPIVARLADAQNNPVANVNVVWSASGGGATFSPASSTTSATGLASTIVTLGGTPGPVTVTASGGGFSTNVSLTISGGGPPPPPSNTIAINAGDQQSAPAGTNVAIAPSVLVKDASSNPVPNAVVVFAVTAGGGSVTNASATTNAQGIATVGSWTLGTTPGTNTLTATTGSASVTFTATGRSAGPTHFNFVLSPPASFVVGGSPVTISARLLDAQNAPVQQAGITVTLTGVASPGPNFGALQATTDATGTATFSVPSYIGKVGSVILSVTSPGLTSLVTSSIPIVAGTASAIIVSTQPASGATSGALLAPQPVAQLADVGGNPVSTANVAIVASISTGGGTLSGTTTINTDATGKATYTDLIITGTAGPRTLLFTAGSFSAQSNTVNVTVVGTQLSLGGWTVSGSTAAGAAFVPQPTVALVDANNTPVATAGVLVTATIASGPNTPTPTVLNATATTNANGQAIFTGLGIGGAVGSYTLTFSAPSFTSATSGAVVIGAGAASQIAINSGQGQSGTVSTAVSIAPSVKVVDSFNNPVANVAVTFTASSTSQVSNGTTSGTSVIASTNASGIASVSWILGNTAGAYTLTADAGSLGGSPLTFNATAAAGAGTSLALVQTPSPTASSGSPLSVQPIIQLKDSQGNNVATAGVVVTASIAGGTGTLSNATATTTSAGTATFSGLTISGTVGNFTLQFAASGFNPLTFGPIALSAGAPTTLSIATQPAANGTSGVVLGPQPVIQLLDANANHVNLAGSPITALLVLITPASGTLSGTVTLNTNANGQASFTDLAISGPPGTYALDFSSTAGPPTVRSNVINLVNATATKMALVQPVPASITVGQPFPAPVQVQLLDANNNPVPSANVQITATGNVQPSNTTFAVTAATNSSGIATFTVPPYVGKIGTLTFTLTSANITTLTTAGINVLAGAPAQLVITTQPASSAISGSPLAPQPAVQVADVGANPVNASVNVAATIQSGSGTLGGTTSVATNASGLATFTNLSLSGAPGPFTLLFASGTLQTATSSTINLGAGGPAAMTIVAGDQQTVTAGNNVPTAPSVRVTDASGNPLQGVSVTFTPTQGGGLVTGGVVVTNAAGIATVGSWQLGKTAGPNKLDATAGSLLAQFTATGVSGPATQMAFVTSTPATASSGSALSPQPSVQLLDQNGNSVASLGVQVTASIASGSGTLTNATAATNAGGLATFSGLTITGTAGPFTLQFNATGVSTLVSPSIALSAGTATAMTIVAGDLQTATAGTNVAIAPSVRVTDGSGNPLPNVSVTFTPTLGGGTVTGATVQTSASGVATVGSWQLGTTAGTNKLVASAGSLNATFTATSVAGPATQLAFVTTTPPTASSGSALSPQPSVQLQDQHGNSVSSGGVQVTATIASGSGSLANATATTTSGGLATFSGLTITGTAGPFTLQFSAPGVSPLVSPAIALAAGTATSLTITTQPAASAQSGVALAPQPVLQLRDANGNPVPQAGVDVVATLSNRTGTLSGTTTVKTNASGQASFTDLVITGAGTFTLIFDTTNPTATVTSTSITVSAGPVTQLVVLTAPQTGAILSTLPQPIVVEARDASNTPVSGVSIAITPRLNSTFRNGTPSPSSQITGANGQISFTWKLGNGAKVDTMLIATSTNSVQTFTLATAVAGPASQLIYLDQPGNGSPASGGTAMPPLHIAVSDSGGVDTIKVITPITLSIRSGTGTPGAILTGNGPVSTVNGIATFNAVTIDKAGTGYILNATNGSIGGASLPFTVVAGAATSIRFTQQPTPSTGGVAISPAVVVTLVDAGGNTVTANSTSTVTLTITAGTGTPGATLSGGGPITFVNGVATFSTASVDFGGTAYTLRATTNALNGQGGPIPAITSAAFDVVPGTTQLLTTKAGTRINVSPVGAVNPPTVTRPVFVAKNAQGNPAPNLTINILATGRCLLDNGTSLVSSLSMTSDVNGEVKPLVRLPAGVDGAGCLIKASAPSFTTSTDSSQIAVFPAGTSHVWTGALSNTWTNASNWVPVISVPNVPSSPSDVVFIPNYQGGGFNAPLVSGPKPSMNRLAMDTAALVQANGIGIDIGSGGVTGLGVVINGSIHLQATASVNGIFDILDIGQAGSCGAAGPMIGRLLTVSATVLNVRCRTHIDTTAVSTQTVNVFPNAGQGWLNLTTNRAGLSVSGNASFTGDSLWVTNGVIVVGGAASFGFGGVSYTGGSLQVQGSASFASDHAFYSSSTILVGGSVTFGGAGAGQQQFAGGLLSVGGDFTQSAGTKVGQTGLTFTTSSDHITHFVGSATQTISFATPTTSRFSVLQAQNSSVGGVQIATDAESINGTAQPRVDLLGGRLQVNSGKNFTLNRGSVLLGFQSNLNLIGNIVNAVSCSGRTKNSATVTGTGTFNGAPITATTCTP